MLARLIGAAWVLALMPLAATAQMSSGGASSAITAEPLPPPSPSGEAPPPVAAAPSPALPSEEAVTAPAAPAAPGATASGDRVFCEQAVNVRLADPGVVPQRYRAFIGIWSDAAWSPQLCAALIVASVAADGTASIVYVYGPMGSGGRGAGGVLHGTGVIRDGELRFQNSDGSQFAFHPVYADLAGQLTTPQGQNYQAIFKKTP